LAIFYCRSSQIFPTCRIKAARLRTLKWRIRQPTKPSHPRLPTTTTNHKQSPNPSPNPTGQPLATPCTSSHNQNQINNHPASQLRVACVHFATTCNSLIRRQLTRHSFVATRIETFAIAMLSRRLMLAPLRSTAGAARRSMAVRAVAVADGDLTPTSKVGVPQVRRRVVACLPSWLAGRMFWVSRISHPDC
jgi:hypothetical protein